MALASYYSGLKPPIPKIFMENLAKRATHNFMVVWVDTWVYPYEKKNNICRGRAVSLPLNNNDII
ncbi:hypothetical protein, partial [Sulfurovum sp. bin170]|uniref:hypothetical protein n=1 Tax=Sulfurovum sp. bin170 TaxID=2695268 RepID=UPI001CB724F4